MKAVSYTMNFLVVTIVFAAVLMLSACGTMQDSMTYLQSNTGFCSGGTKWMHNQDGTATKLYGQGGQALRC
jgi:hypothetical protein